MFFVRTKTMIMAQRLVSVWAILMVASCLALTGCQKEAGTAAVTTPEPAKVETAPTPPQGWESLTSLAVRFGAAPQQLRSYALAALPCYDLTAALQTALDADAQTPWREIVKQTTADHLVMAEGLPAAIERAVDVAIRSAVSRWMETAP